MNKKFSTLVAALLVSGVSYAVVDTFNSYAMTNAPLAKAATANVNLRSLVTPASDLTFESSTFANASKWNIVAMSGQASKFMLTTTTTPTCYLTKDGTMSDALDDAAEIKLAIIGAATGPFALQVATDDGDRFLVITKDGKQAFRANAAAMEVGDKPLFVYTDKDTQKDDAISNVANDVVIAQDMNYWNTATAKVAQAQVVDNGSAFAKRTKTANVTTDGTTEITKYTIAEQSNTGNKILTIGASQYLKVEGSSIVITANESEATSVSVDASSKQVKFGDYYLFSTDEGVLSVGVVGDGSLDATRVYAYEATATGAALENGTTFAVGTKAFLVIGDNNITTSGSTADCVCYDAKPATVNLVAGDIASVYNQTNTNDLVFTGTAAGATLKLTNPIGATAGTYYFRYDGDATELSTTAGQNGFTFEVTTNALMMNNKLVLLNTVTGEYVLGTAETTTLKKVYLYEVDATTKNIAQTVSTSIADNKEYVISTPVTDANGDIVTTITAPTSIDNFLTVKYNTGATIADNLMKLVDGAYYRISFDKTQSSNYLESAYNSDKEAVIVNKAALDATGENYSTLWKVKVIKGKNGEVSSFRFTNKETGEPLAFKAKASAVNNGVASWTITYDAAGTYKNFIVDADGRISFALAEPAGSFEGHTYAAATDRFALNYTPGTPAIWTTIPYGSSAQLLKVSEVKDVPATNMSVAEQIKWLNVTAGDGHGFDVLIKNAKGDKLSPVANKLTDQRITAVQGPDLSYIRVYDAANKTYNDYDGNANDLTGKIFFRVGADSEYAYTKTYAQRMVDEYLAGKTATISEANLKQASDDANRQLADFRASKFVVVDTVLYSSELADNVRFYQFAVANGSELLSATGYVAENSNNGSNVTFNASTGKYQRDGVETNDYNGLKRSIQNAAFEVLHLEGNEISDPIAVVLKDDARFPVTAGGYKNYQGVFGHTVEIASLNVDVKKIGDAYYVGASDAVDADLYPYIYAGLNNDVNYKDVNGIVNIYNANYDNKGEIYGYTGEGFDYFEPKYINADAPEGQFLVSWDKVKGTFTFTNRESQEKLGSQITLKDVRDDKGNLVENVYAVIIASQASITGDTIKIVPAKDGGKFGGYLNDYTADELKGKLFNLSLKSGVEGLGDIYVKENHSDEKHILNLTKDSEDAGKFRLIKFANEGKDSIYVSVSTEDNPVKYVLADGKEKDDYVVAFTYAIYNEETKEYVTFTNWSNTNYFYCNAGNKYIHNEDANYTQRFIIKEKANGIQLIPVNNYGEIESFYSANRYGKAYAATYTENKIATEENIYKITDNDLFQLTDVDAAMYYKFENAYDTVRLYKADMPNDMTALYAKSADKSVVSGAHFLAMDHQADVETAKFSFFVDTAYVRGGTYKPQYLLAIDAVKANKLEDCDIAGHEPHDTGVVDTVYGKFLVSMVDSISVWGNKHSNPYWFDSKEYARLGFVNAKHTGDSLIIVRDDAKLQTKADTINLSNNDEKIGAYAFRYVNSGSEKFVIETAYKNQYNGAISTGYIKWMNGTPVVVNDIDIAEVFELKKTDSTPTANESINGASTFSVATIDGAVVVKGAEGKNVVLTNVLGQTIASTVITSSEATISVPAGVVVVAVEGEAAVKAIVK